MDVLDDLSRARVRGETILTIGAFDGVHRGHQALIRQIVERAHDTGRIATVITFYPHPAAVLAPHRAPRLLTTPGEKLALLERLGVDLVALLPFDKVLASWSAAQFMQAACQGLRVCELWVGADFSLGHKREGNVDRLRELGQMLGYEVHVVRPVTGAEVSGAPGDGEGASGAIISSSRIRALLREGRVEDVAELLGRFFRVAGEVVRGARRGHDLGFPTANLKVRPERAVPADGVYAAFAMLGDVRYPAVANVGLRPSFDNGERTVETHIFDFDQDIYGCDLVVEFVARLREERRFADIGELVEQMRSDSRAARELLERHGQVGYESPHSPCSYRFEEIEHMADRALRVWGASDKDLFVGAARGMSELMSDVEGLVADRWRQIRLQSLDREGLLVQWLNELLFLTESEGLVFTEFAVESLTGTALRARAGGALAPVTKAHIKAATYHNLELIRDETGWATVVTFDV